MKNHQKEVRIVGVLAFLVVNWVGAIVISNFFEENTLHFRTPIIIQSPVVVKSKTVNPLPEKKDPIIIVKPTGVPVSDTSKKLLLNEKENTEAKLSEALYPSFEEKMAIVKASKYPTEILRIWQHESQKGRTKDVGSWTAHCISKGGTNEFGLKAKDGNIACYKSFIASVKDVELTLKNLGYETNEVKTMCVYGGEPLVNGTCGYYQRHLSMGLE